MTETKTRFKLSYRYKKLLADTITPVNIYLKLRDRFANSILLESSDYHGSENSFSYICCSPMASFVVKEGSVYQGFPDGSKSNTKLDTKGQVVQLLTEFVNAFETRESSFKFISNGLFGYMAYDAIEHFEDISLKSAKPDHANIPSVFYQVFRFVIAIDHFRNELHVFEHYLPENEADNGLDEIINLINNKNFPSYHFQFNKKETSNFDEKGFLEIVKKGIHHCERGDVFQIVLSRQYNCDFLGDEFNVYRSLRSINPSPYLFYFDFGSFKIFGSSPEAQIEIKDQVASIYPIAGTFKRTGDDAHDAQLAKELYDDPKENSEHVMLVDLARNDLSRNGEEVKVETFKEIQFYSHVIHLVSKVTARLSTQVDEIQVVADTFPAGTLSGAPKYRAMELIDVYEGQSRGYYGGAIGFLGFNGDFNHAIMIRSFLSRENNLYYQAGAGVVAKSVPENEVKEVENKLAALRKALRMAESIGNGNFISE